MQDVEIYFFCLPNLLAVLQTLEKQASDVFGIVDPFVFSRGPERDEHQHKEQTESCCRKEYQGAELIHKKTTLQRSCSFTSKLTWRICKIHGKPYE